ncbi:MAG: sulfite exporter TauE/SafE family protein [Faecousia sp.]
MASNLIRKNLRIGGMTCVQCQNKIEKKLRSTDGVVKVSVSYTKGTADITYDADKLSLGDIKRIIEKLDYQVLPDGQNSGTKPGRVAGTLIIIVGLFVILQHFGVLNLLVPSQLADSSMGYGMLFVIGLATSVHCIAMCGGINLSQALPQDSETGGSTGAALLPSFLYNLGRVISYTAIGFVLGAVGFLIGGGQVGLSTLLQGVLKLIAGTFMVIMGINMLGLFPWLRRFMPRMPRFLTQKLGTKRAKAAGPLTVGLLNGLMPCGPLQSMQIVAMASGSPFTGALSMFLFSLGTVPLMLGLGSLVSVLGKQFTKTVNYVGAILVAVLGLAMLSQGASLSGFLLPETLQLLVVFLCILGIVASVPFRKKALRIAAMAAVVCVAAVLAVVPTLRGSAVPVPQTDRTVQVERAEDVQIVNSTLSIGRYPSITVQVGKPVKWIIDAPAGSINGCNYTMIIPAYNMEYTFHEGENIIEFTPTETGTVRYCCWMGMIWGSILVTDESPDDGSLNEASEATVNPTETYAIPYSLPSCCQ